ncbi:MAG: hypothetical protein A3J08_03720 [Candidatus Lloydbacteria bacterium RIFCSPLOWO2_02_FULL_51_11]|uniref:Transcription regulator TrmB N-terminal domain-containing protein n=1 Tax=Candidatus Lloydbacteria bacterium RIFCSPLOWO2_02_FULL_51_11 TaxID=1798667 RepID=A0A1G2DLZ7_9BACT|nr:MAG: hypothetical protein A3J08_03720 [Candidatus Lloydbacteria bacterium RIFCSPLOWO2_02_FULL_51_11]
MLAFFWLLWYYCVDEKSRQHMNKSEKNILEPLGFDSKTEQAYRALIRLADAPAYRVAKESGIKRTTIYHVLENLVSQGLASAYTARGVRRYVAESPHKLKNFFEQKTILAERIIPLLLEETHKQGALFKLGFLEGKEALRGLSEEALEAKEKNILSIGSSRGLVAFLGGKYGYGKRRRERGIRTRALRLKGDEESTHSALTQIRFLPKTTELPGHILIFDNTVGVILFEGNGYGFVVRSKAFTRVMRSLFETLWQTAR